MGPIDMRGVGTLMVLGAATLGALIIVGPPLTVATLAWLLEPRLGLDVGYWHLVSALWAIWLSFLALCVLYLLLADIWRKRRYRVQNVLEKPLWEAWRADTSKPVPNMQPTFMQVLRGRP